MNKSGTSTHKAIDPVCGMTVDPDKTKRVAVIEGVRYYFCAEACRKAFETNPQKYLMTKPAKRKGIWGRYLDRLNKTTQGKSMQCH